MDIEVVIAVKKRFPNANVTSTDYSVTVKIDNVTMTVEDYDLPPYVDDIPDTFSASDAAAIVKTFEKVF